MPTMFDSHEEFNEWFSKDIENHAERQSGIDAGECCFLVHLVIDSFLFCQCRQCDVDVVLSLIVYLCDVGVVPSLIVYQWDVGVVPSLIVYL